MGCSYLGTVVSEIVQQHLWVSHDCNLIPIRPRDGLYQCHTDVKYSKKLHGEVKVYTSKLEFETEQLQSHRKHF